MLEPIGDKVVILPITAESVSDGGIVIPDAAVEKPCRGAVVASGNDQLKPGDVVHYGKSHGTEIKHEGETLLVIDGDLILCKET